MIPSLYKESLDGGRDYAFTTKSGKAVSFHSPFESDTDAVNALITLVNTGKVTSDFAKELALKANLSPMQLAWVHKCAADASYVDPIKGGNIMPSAISTTGDGLAKLLDLFKTAKTHLKRPAIVVAYSDDIDWDVKHGKLDSIPRFRVTPAPDKGKNPGQLYVQRAASEGAAWVYMGKVDTVGNIGWGPMAGTYKPVIEKLLGNFAADPVGTASTYGKLTGRCCFCNQKLTDEKSTAVGYGKVCAKHFELPWGDVKTDLATGGVVPAAKKKPVLMYTAAEVDVSITAIANKLDTVKIVSGAKIGPWEFSEAKHNIFNKDCWCACASDFPPGTVPTLPSGEQFDLSTFHTFKTPGNDVIMQWYQDINGCRFIIHNK